MKDQIIEHLRYLDSIGVKNAEPLQFPSRQETITSNSIQDKEMQDSEQLLQELWNKEVDGCKKCKLSGLGRTNIVFGEGAANADLMFIGEGPGRDEDIQGKPFVGRAGQKLNDIIKAMGLKREDVFIANIVKCRPPENRNPEKDEVASCLPFLHKQIDIIKPKVICALGSVSAQTLLEIDTPISKMRGNFYDYRGIPLMPTFHPAYLLRNYTPETRRKVWEDMQKIMDVLTKKDS